MVREPPPFHCPTFPESYAATLDVLPRGRAWPANDPSVVSGFLAWLVSLVGVPAADQWPVGYVQAGYYAAFASVRNYLEQRLCALRLEFWCATHSETHDQWMIEYGLPDNCDPFPDLCTKVAAIGGTRCEYYAEVAARAGWSIYCDAIANDCGANAGCAQAGCDIAGGLSGSAILRIVVDLNQSPAHVVAVGDLPYAGNFESGFSLGCEPDINALQCLLDRVVHAHIVIQYVTTGA
jgi:hypothetical protein